MNVDNVQGTETSGEAHQEPAPETPLAGAPVEAVADAVSPETNLHASLLEGVSAEALTIGGVGEAEAHEAAAPHAEAGELAAAEPEGVPPADDLTLVQDTAAETAETASAVVETVTQAQQDVIAQASAQTSAQALPILLPMTVPALPDLRALMDVARTPRIAEVMGAFGEVNATVMSYLRDEGTAALAHWQALSGARTPADAIRIQVDEMQRAANASLSCFSALAQRASRFTGSAGQP